MIGVVNRVRLNLLYVATIKLKYFEVLEYQWDETYLQLLVERKKLRYTCTVYYNNCILLLSTSLNIFKCEQFDIFGIKTLKSRGYSYLPFLIKLLYTVL